MIELTIAELQDQVKTPDTHNKITRIQFSAFVSYHKNQIMKFASVRFSFPLNGGLVQK